MDHVLVESLRFDDEVHVFGPLSLYDAQRLMLERAREYDDTCRQNGGWGSEIPKTPEELDDNYHLDTENVTYDIVTLHGVDPKDIT